MQIVKITIELSEKAIASMLGHLEAIECTQYEVIKGTSYDVMIVEVPLLFTSLIISSCIFIARNYPNEFLICKRIETL